MDANTASTASTWNDDVSSDLSGNDSDDSRTDGNSKPSDLEGFVAKLCEHTYWELEVGLKSLVQAYVYWKVENKSRITRESDQMRENIQGDIDGIVQVAKRSICDWIRPEDVFEHLEELVQDEVDAAEAMAYTNIFGTLREFDTNLIWDHEFMNRD